MELENGVPCFALERYVHITPWCTPERFMLRSKRSKGAQPHAAKAATSAVRYDLPSAAVVRNFRTTEVSSSSPSANIFLICSLMFDLLDLNNSTNCAP